MAINTGSTRSGAPEGKAKYVARGDDPLAQNTGSRIAVDPADRQPKGDHNRRLALFADPEAFAAEAGITAEQLRTYESTPPDGTFDIEVARRIGEALDRLETATPTDEKIMN